MATAGGDRPLFSRSVTAHGASQSVPEAGSPAVSGLPERRPRRRSPRPPEERRVSAPRFRRAADVIGFVPASGDQATSQVDRPAQTQAVGNLAKSLPASREKAA